MAWQHPRRRDLLILDVGLEGAARAAGNRPTLRAGVAGGGGLSCGGARGGLGGGSRAARSRCTGQATGGGWGEAAGQGRAGHRGERHHRRRGGRPSGGWGGCGTRGDEWPRGRVAARSRHGRLRHRPVTEADRGAALRRAGTPASPHLRWVMVWPCGGRRHRRLHASAGPGRSCRPGATTLLVAGQRANRGGGGTAGPTPREAAGDGPVYGEQGRHGAGSRSVVRRGRARTGGGG